MPSDATPPEPLAAELPAEPAASTLMWEARVAEGRIVQLLEFVRAHADPAAQIYRADGPDPRVVVIDPTGRGLPDAPADLVARPPLAWSFTPVPR